MTQAALHPLRKRRNRIGMTQAALAKKARIGPADIVAIEKGYRLPGKLQAKKIAAALGVKVESLFKNGFSMPNWRRGKKEPELPYVPEPPATPKAVPRYPEEFDVYCWRCGKRIRLRACDYHPQEEDDLRCPSCSRAFEVRVRPEDAPVPEPPTPPAPPKPMREHDYVEIC